MIEQICSPKGQGTRQAADRDVVRPEATRAGREWSDQEQTGFVMSNQSWNQCWNVEHEVTKICQKACVMLGLKFSRVCWFG